MVQLTDKDKEFIKTKLKQYLEQDEEDCDWNEIISVLLHGADISGNGADIFGTGSIGRVGRFLYELGLPIEEATKEYFKKNDVCINEVYLYTSVPCLFEVMDESCYETYGWVHDDDAEEWYASCSSGDTNLTEEELLSLEDFGFRVDNGSDVGYILLPPCEVYYANDGGDNHTMQINGKEAWTIVDRLGFTELFEEDVLDINRYKDIDWKNAFRSY